MLLLADIELDNLHALLRRFGLVLVTCARNAAIPGSYWGGDEAGLKGNSLYARDTTPLHSILHETCHYICVDPERRQCLDTNAGSDEAEENAVCYLQILLAANIPEFSRERMFSDMDAWGYSFRLGCSKAWFELDAEDASKWLLAHNLIDHEHRPKYRLRVTADNRRLDSLKQLTPAS